MKRLMNFLALFTAVDSKKRKSMKSWSRQKRMMSQHGGRPYRVISVGVVSIARSTCREGWFLKKHAKSTLKNKINIIMMNICKTKRCYNRKHSRKFFVYIQSKCKQAPSWIFVRPVVNLPQIAILKRLETVLLGQVDNLWQT